MCYHVDISKKLVRVVLAAAVLGLIVPAAASARPDAFARTTATQDLATDFVCATLKVDPIEASLKKFLQGLVGGPRTIAGKLVGGVVGAAITFCPELVKKARSVANRGVQRLLGPAQPPNTPPLVIPPSQRVRGDLILRRDGWVPVNVFWASLDTDGVKSHDLEAFVNGAPEQVDVTSASSGTYNVKPGNRYQFTVRSQDHRGKWSAFAEGREFGLSLASEQVAAHSTYWTTNRNADALGGSDSYSQTPGAWISYTFNGDYVAWVGPTWASGGRASVFIDGQHQDTVSLHSRGTTHRRVLSAWQWPSRGRHTIRVQVQSGGVEVDGFIFLN